MEILADHTGYAVSHKWNPSCWDGTKAIGGKAKLLRFKADTDVFQVWKPWCTPQSQRQKWRILRRLHIGLETARHGMAWQQMLVSGGCRLDSCLTPFEESVLRRLNMSDAYNHKLDSTSPHFLKRIRVQYQPDKRLQVSLLARSSGLA